MIIPQSVFFFLASLRAVSTKESEQQILLARAENSDDSQQRVCKNFQ